MSDYRETAQSGWIEYRGFRYYELARQEYAGNNSIFATGMIEGHPVDTHYLWLEKDGQEPTIILLRPDELATIAWLCSGALWSKLIGELTPDGK